MGGETGMAAGVASGMAEPECPRCGYDLSGQAHAAAGVAADSFPVGGRCSECGLAFAWGDVFNPGRERVPGFIEHARAGWWSLFAAAWRTWWMAARVLPFWGRVRLEMPVQVGRVWLWPVITVVAVVVAGSAACSLMMETLMLARPMPSERWAGHLLLWSAGIADWDPWTSGIRFPGGAAVAGLGPLGAWAVMWAVMLCLPDTRRVSKVRAAHVLRAGVYGLAWLVPVLVWRTVAWTLMSALVLLRESPLGPGAAQAVTRVTRWVNEAMEVGVEAAEVYAALAVVWLTVWWFSAIRDGWRVKEYGKVWLAVVVPGWLALAVMFVLLGYGVKLFL